MYILLCLSLIALYLLTFLRIKDWQYILISISVMSFFSYFYNPYLAEMYLGDSFSTDLTRHYYALDVFRKMGDEYTEYLISPIFYIAFLWYSQLFDVNDYFQVICTVVTYSLSLTSAYLYGMHFQLSKHTRLFMYFTLIGTLNYFYVIDNIRYPMAFACFVLITYYDFVKGGKFYALYIVPILMHPGLAVMVILRYVSKARLSYIMIILGSLLLFMYLYLYDFIFYLISFASAGSEWETGLMQFQSKSLLYLSDSKDSINSNIILMCISFIYLICAFRYIDRVVIKNYFYKLLVVFFLVSCIMILLGSSDFAERFSYIIPYAFAFFFAYSSKAYKKINVKFICEITKIYILTYVLILYLNQYKYSLAICIVG